MEINDNVGSIQAMGRQRENVKVQKDQNNIIEHLF
jgi:hypothetical protein